MNSWRKKFRNFLGDFPVHYATLFINRTINNNYMTLLMVLHHAHDGFWYFFDDLRATIVPGNSAFPDVILVPNYHSYKKKQ